MSTTADNLKKLMVQTGKMMHQRGFVSSTNGNISVKAGKNKIFITPSRICKGFLKISDIVTIDLKGKVIAGSMVPSIETPMHLAIYKNRPDIKAVIHAHPPFSTVAGLRAEPSKPFTINHAFTGKIPVAGFAPPGSEKLISLIKPLVLKHNIILLGHHGIIVFSTDITKAYFELENSEYCFEISVLCKLMGNCKYLTKKQITQTKKLTNGSNLCY